MYFATHQLFLFDATHYLIKALKQTETFYNQNANNNIFIMQITLRFPILNLVNISQKLFHDS